MVIKLISTFSLVVICMFSATASAEETSTIAELKQMIMSLVANQEKLEQEQERLEQELIQVRSEATDAKQERAVTREEVAETQTAAIMRPQNTDSGGYANLDFIYKRPVIDRLTYAQYDEKYTDENGNYIQKNEAIDIKTEYERGFRIGLGYLSNRGAEAFINYSLLSTSADDSVTDSNPDSDKDILPKLVPELGPDFDQEEALVSASGSYDLRYRVLDAGFAQNLDIGNQLDLRFGGGLRYASIDDNLHGNYVHHNYKVNAAGNVSRDRYEILDTQIKNDFWAIGPRATVDATWHIPNTGGLNIFGGLGASLLYGENDFSFLSQGQGPELFNYDLTSFTNVEKHLYPVVEANVGAAYSGSNYNLRLGYEFESWFDAISRADFVDSSNENLFVREDTDLSLHGLFFRGTIKW